MRQVPIATLEKTFREAIKLCEDLNIGFVWIDCLCIIQQDERDWLEHAPIMHLVYQHSFLNLAACASSASSEGLLRPFDPEFFQQLVIDVPFEEHSSLWRLLRSSQRKTERLCSGSLRKAFCESGSRHEWTYWWNELPLFSRSWVCQEIFMAPRVVYLTNQQIYWKCKGSLAPEIGTFKPHTYVYAPLEPSEGVEALNEAWFRVMTDYVTSSVSFKRDRIFALAGLAAWFGARFQEAGIETQYCMGCWSHEFSNQFLWHLSCDPDLYRQRSKDDDVGIPSWSWLSMHLPLDFRANHRNGSLTLTRLNNIHLKATLEDEGIPYGLLRELRLLIKSPICVVTLDSYTSSNRPTSGYSLYKDGGNATISILNDSSSESKEVLFDQVDFWPDWVLTEPDSDANGRRILCIFVVDEDNCANEALRHWALAIAPSCEVASDGRATYERIGLLHVEFDWPSKEPMLNQLSDLLHPDRAHCEEFYLV